MVAVVPPAAPIFCYHRSLPLGMTVLSDTHQNVGSRR